MPSEFFTALDDQPQIEHVQAKVCSSCHRPVDPTSHLFLLAADAIVCAACGPIHGPQIDSRTSCIDVDSAFLRLGRPTHDQDPSDTQRPAPPPPPNFASKFSSLSVHTPTTTVSSSQLPQPHAPILPVASSNRRHTALVSLSPNPLTDITRLRVRTQAHHCLYPGASFQGTQKSGRNSYDVTVTIVDVDFSSSFLCGYLCIRGLTEDYPELTTYFDAEIIGSRYGFRTQNWGANEADDMVHWSRFPAFRHVKHDLKRPHYTIPDRDRGAVFMRWKERFLVPDHRVQDINGASFAGFYYVCVDFNPAQSSQNEEPTSPMAKSESRERRESSARRSPSAGPRLTAPPAATMSGFYYHQNSEPYQQLTLAHVPERASSSFEFR
ncbi:vacuolar import and degradation protein-domain-containing protein [Desarmillaria tabescens]|uniref:Vacuolar import and degradation protein-domain-containing protein n=1 Tax=Armillaria tabescens TaxID=1929756 RepID=A0AA39NE47_ARMTA|nr:vacuolar import and degradation protein-domain-containing protein [Desarmillaria tabescens]KAK0463983.1 vacuolar import and degradation protein-domain-containing protein [Desarmillaria tabescens]